MIANIGLREYWARTLASIVSGGVAAGALVLGLLNLGSGLLDPKAAADAGTQGAPALIICGAAACACVVPDVRIRLARVLPIDPESPVHLVALVLSLSLFGLQLESAFGGALSQAAGSAQPLSKADLVAGEVPFVLAAVLGVGLFVRRDFGQTAQRLGYTRPPWWHVVLALAAAGAFFALGFGLDYLGQVLTPGTAKEVNSATNRIFGQLTVDPGGVATIAITAGVCEEALFRGALQPRLGIVWTSLVFASVHTQYGLSFDALAVLILAVGLGLLRRFLSTTTSTICHVAYDFLAGFGLTAAALPWAIGAEAGLVAVLGGLLALHLRAPKPAASVLP